MIWHKQKRLALNLPLFSFLLSLSSLSLHFSALFMTSCLDSGATATGGMAGAGGIGGGVSGGFEELRVDGGEKPGNFDPKDDLEGFFIG